ncbi:MAG: rod shape-determining protein RodA [Candidatus Omnitrophica bacterium]|nr:rod shape-determining protein RodA [Candidatus Omnitrophota bacterium]
MDKTLLAAVITISLLGIFFVFSASSQRGTDGPVISQIVIKQAIWIFAGLAVMVLIANSDYRRSMDFAPIFYLVILVLLVFLLMLGGERFGAKRWIGLGFFSIQPSEFVKLAVILVLSGLLRARKERARSLGNFVLALALVAPAFLLIFKQPDLGTAMILVPVVYAVLFVSGENIKYMMTTIILGLISTPLFWNLLKGYQKSRLMVFLNPNLDPLGAGYTIIQSKIAIGSGGFLGKGWLHGTQSQLKFLPERHTDFIFSVIGEEWGFAGAIVLLLLYAIVVARGVRIISGTDDIFGKGVVTGIVTLFAVQVVVNISMTIGLMPVVGFPLPLISYGGSSAIVFLVGTGLMLSVSRQRVR